MKLYGVTFFVSDLPGATVWYADLLGLKPARASENFVQFILSQGTVNLHPADDKCQPGLAGQVVYLQVDSLEDSVSRLESLGAIILRQPMTDSEGDTVCQIQDPFGNAIGLIEPKI